MGTQVCSAWPATGLDRAATMPQGSDAQGPPGQGPPGGKPAPPPRWSREPQGLPRPAGLRPPQPARPGAGLPLPPRPRGPAAAPTGRPAWQGSRSRREGRPWARALCHGGLRHSRPAGRRGGGGGRVAKAPHGQAGRRGAHGPGVGWVDGGLGRGAGGRAMGSARQRPEAWAAGRGKVTSLPPGICCLEASPWRPEGWGG